MSGMTRSSESAIHYIANGLFVLSLLSDVCIDNNWYNLMCKMTFQFDFIVKYALGLGLGLGTL